MFDLSRNRRLITFFDCAAWMKGMDRNKFPIFELSVVWAKLYIFQSNKFARVAALSNDEYTTVIIYS